MSTFAEYTNKKKKKTVENTSFREYTKSVLGDAFEDDIAPVRTTGGGKRRETTVAKKEEKEKEQKWYEGWFDKGAFEDDKGNVATDTLNAIAYTPTDILLGATRGALGLVEGLKDAAAYGLAYGSKAIGYEKGYDYLKEHASMSDVDYLLGDVSKFVNERSVFGERTKGSFDALGYVLGIVGTGGLGSAAGLSSAGTTALTSGVTFASATGGGISEAYNEGATDTEAAIYGVSQGAIEAASEMMFGGLGKAVKAKGLSYGVSNLDDVIAKKIGSKISNEFLSNAAEWGVKSTAEGVEELAAGVGSAVAKKLTYMDDEEFGQLIKDEQLFDQFVGGVFASAVMQSGYIPGTKSGSLREANKTGTDFITGLTENEQAVITKEVENRIAEEEAGGEKLDNKAKKKIEDQVMKDFEKGYISTDTIESVIGGDTYRNYKSITNMEETLKDEIKRLENDPRPFAQNRVEEARNQLKQLEESTKKAELKDLLSNKVEVLTRGSRLGESYREIERRSQRFEADLTKYDEKTKTTIQRAINSGILNNTNRTHEFVDMIAKLSTDKGVSFDFTNNENLKKSGFALEGKTINGLVKDGNIILNIDSKKALNTIVGHEITHVLEGTELYAELQKAVKEYATTNGDYEARFQALSELYKNVEGADIEAEITADLVGDYLFTDADFVTNLHAKKPNVFKKIFEEIKYLCKVATAGSKEARQLEKVRRTFEKAYRESAEMDSEAEHIGYDDDVRYSIAVEDENTLDMLDEQLAKGEYDEETNPDGGYYVTYKSMSFWGYDEDGNAILRSPMAEYVDGKLSGAYLIPKDKSKVNWYQSTETIDEKTGLPAGLLVKTRKPGNKSDSYLPATENQDLINDDWSNLYFNLKKKIWKNGKWVNSDVPARYNPYEHSSNSMLNDQFDTAYMRDNLVTVKMYVPRSEDGGTYRAQWSKDATGWTDWKTGVVAGKIGKQKDLQRRLYLSRYAAPVEIVPDSEVAKTYQEYLEGTDVAIPDNVVSPNLLNELKNLGVPIKESGKVKYSLSTEREAFPKTKNTMKPTTANLQKEMLTVRDVRNDTMRKHNYTEKDVKQVNDFMDNIGTFMEKAGVTYKYIGLEDVNNAKLKVVFDKNGNPQRVTMSAMVQNGDYPVNFDFTSICKKRQSMSMVIKEMAKRQTADGKRTLDTINLDAKALWTINEELRKAGLETACLGCFVEAKRYNIQNFADKATNMWNKIVDEVRMEQGYTTDAEYFNLAEGVDLDSVDYTEVENIFKAYSQEPGRTSPETRMRALIKNGGEMYQKYLQASDIMTPEGIEALKSLSTKKNNLYGIIQGVYGQAAPKEVMGFTPYNSEVALLPEKKNGKDMAKYIASIGGVRMQSFSDFVVANVYDYMQMVADLSARHLPAHAYTKEIAFAKIFGLTGIKINMSVMFDIDSNLPDEYAGLQFIPDPNGTENYNGMQGRFEYLVGYKKRSDEVYAKTGERPYVQSIGYDEAVELQNTEGYSKNVGIIGVGFSDKHIEKMLDDNNIRYVIPYHASSLPAVIKGVTNIAKAKDYTDYQNTIIDGKKKPGLGGFDIYADVEKTKNPKHTANNYLNWVRSKGGTPIFDDFSWHENYYKLLFDFDPYDVLTGEYSPQTEVQNIYKGYNPAAGMTSTTEIESIIDNEMNVQNEANRARNEMLPGVVDNVLEQLGVENETPKLSLSDSDEVAPTKHGNFYGKDIKYIKPQDNVAKEEPAPIEEVAPFAEDYAPMNEVDAYIRDAHQENNAYFPEDIAPEEEGIYNGAFADHPTPTNVFYDRNIEEMGDRNIKAYMYEHPEVKPFFQEEARYMLGELDNSSKGEKFYNDQLYYDTNGEMGFFGTKRHTSDDIAYLLDSFGYTYKDIAKGLNAIIEDNGKENNAISKRIEFLLDERLRLGYRDFWLGDQVPPNQDYINLLNEKQITDYSDESWDYWLRNLSEDDLNSLRPTPEIAPAPAEYIPAEPEYAAIRPKPEKAEKEPRMVRVETAEKAAQKPAEPIAKVLTEEPAPEKKRSRFWSQAAELTLDKGFVFENLSKKTKNRELEAKWNYIRYADSKAQDFIGKGAEGVKSLNDIKKDVESAGLTQEVYEYVYHLHNIDRMSLADRFDDGQNKAVFGDSVTPDVSRKIVAELEAKHPEVKKYANEIYSVNNYLRNLLVEGGVISQETADLWAEMYPHYVPIRRAGDHGLNINVPLDTGRTGVNAPVKRATGGSSDILPLFDTMAQRALQTYKAVAKNSFGVELKNALGTTVGTETADVDSVIDGLDQSEELLQKGKNGRKPTFTVFEGGERVTFEITEDMYDALKPTSETLAYTNKVANTISNLHRGVLTEYNPAFLASNIIKDVQDVLINSQHPAKTYANFPKAMKEMTVKGKWYKEYLKNGGEQNSYFEKQTNTFAKDKSTFVKVVGMPLNAISVANNYIERLPRLAEYIASREAGRSIEVSMLDSARVTTNFAAGGDLTKFANRNGATFLNASVQGVMQQARNIREAKMNGFKGWAQLATKYAVAGLPAILLNSLLWDDDEEYKNLSDYVKQNYYIVAKYGDGKFVRIPKGRTLAIIQDAIEQTVNTATGNDEADWRSFAELLVSNLAPNNPIEDNILAPVIQAKKNTTWYGDDLVPTRLQDLPAAEQFDETTDSISRWLGEKINVSPYKINYLLDQYTGGVGDTVLPMLTPEAESGEDSTAGKLLAPIRDKFTTDSVLKNQNVSDFYDTSDTLTTNAKASGATDKDVLSNKYINAVKTEIGELYAEKREIQNGDLSDSEKYYLVREIQKKINSLTEKALSEYENVNIDGDYSTVGDRQYRKTDTGWTKITDDQLEKQDEVTRGLGITPAEYWSDKDEYDFAYEYSEKYSFFQKNGITYDDYKTADEDGKRAYSWAYENPGKYTMSKAITDDYMTYYQYKSELSDIKADKDADGKSIAGSAKEKKIEYINNLDLDYGQKIILFRSLYDSKEDKQTYNGEILEYLNSREDLTTDEIKTILEELDFKVYDDGRVEW